MSSEIDFHQLCLEIEKKFTSQVSDVSKWDLLKDFYNKVTKSDPLKISSDYYFILSVLLESLRPTLFSEKWQEKLLDDIFLNGIYHESFLILVKKLGETCESYPQQKILNILQKFLKGTSLENLFLHQCSCSGTWDPNYVLVSRIWTDLITYIISLPERVANKTKGKNTSKIFRSNFYVPLIASTVIKVFSTLHDRIANGQNCTLEFLGNLIGRLSITGNADILAKKLCVEFIKHSESNFIWRKLSQNLISKMPISAFETFITKLLLVIPWYGYIEWILGEETMKMEKLNFLMTVKLISIRHFEQTIILQNIIGHFACSKNRQNHFWKIFELLLKNWTNSYNLKYQSHDQQKYMAVALMICSGWFKVMNETGRTKAYLTDVLQGVELRIGNSNKFVQIIGMVVASELISTMNPEAENFKFEEIGDQSLKDFLQSFTKIPQNPGKDSIFFEEDLKCFEEVESSKNKWMKQLPQKKENKTLDSNLLESDDELEPYDMANESAINKPKQPLYLNDCLQGLIEQENREWFEQCLKNAVNLITSNSDIVFEFAEEMTKVVLHLDNKFSVDDFEDLRMQILVCLATQCPLPVAKYLSTEFYEPNYNISQRLDILEVISRSCLQLSGISTQPANIQQQFTKNKQHSKQAWKLIVEERIAAKTKHITKGPKKPLLEPLENIFAPIAGFFFFPFIHNYYKQNKVLKIFGEDGFVLHKLIYTLGIVMHAASNSPHCSQMGETFLEFLSNVWNHEDSFVREAILFALVTVYASIPGFLLFAADSNLQLAVFKSKEWLESVITHDLDVNCQIKASFAINFIMETLKKELPSISEILNS